MSIDFYPEHRTLDFEGLNMANGNACRVLIALGLEPDSEGEVSAQELIERIVLATNVPQMQPVAIPTVVSGNITFCGVDEEYFMRRFGELRAIAELTLEEGHSKVVWF